MESIYKMVDAVNGLLWGKNILVFMLIGAALYFSFNEFKEKEYDKLADLLRKNLDMVEIYKILEKK